MFIVYKTLKYTLYLGSSSTTDEFVMLLIASKSDHQQGTNSQNSLFLHDLRCRDFEPKSCYMDVNAAVFCNPCCWCRHTHSSCKSNQQLSWTYLQFITSFISFFHSPCLLHVLFLYRMEHVPQKCFLFVNCCRIWKRCIRELLLQFMTVL
jgi:hypothetical protein